MLFTTIRRLYYSQPISHSHITMKGNKPMKKDVKKKAKAMPKKGMPMKSNPLYKPTY